MQKIQLPSHLSPIEKLLRSILFFWRTGLGIQQFIEFNFKRIFQLSLTITSKNSKHISLQLLRVEEPLSTAAIRFHCLWVCIATLTQTHTYLLFSTETRHYRRFYTPTKTVRICINCSNWKVAAKWRQQSREILWPFEGSLYGKRKSIPAFLLHMCVCMYLHKPCRKFKLVLS